VTRRRLRGHILTIVVTCSCDHSTLSLPSATQSPVSVLPPIVQLFAQSILMKITFTTELGQPFQLEIDPSMDLASIMALLEVESGIPVNEQSISSNNVDLSDPTATMRALGVTEGASLALRRKVNIAGRSMEHDSEMMRLQLLGDPELMRQMRDVQPELAHAAQHDPARFAELLKHTHEAMDMQQRQFSQYDADPFDIEAQKKIEEAIRRQAILENMEHAMEYSPEAFGKVIMLYIPMEVNGHPVKAFVDSGAQQTIMSPDLAESCGLTRLIDHRFSGLAVGVGTAKILGRIHSAQIKVADLYLPCSFTVMEGRGVDLLFGLDMLKAHQACIDLAKGVLRIQGREVSFLSEHEIPKKDHEALSEQELLGQANSDSQQPGTGPSIGNTFPGVGRSLGSAPAGSSGGSSASPATIPSASQFKEQDISTIMGLGATRELAIQLLEAAGGNVDAAASLLF
jgi:DNA damage-inducible protein 1